MSRLAPLLLCATLLIGCEDGLSIPFLPTPTPSPTPTPRPTPTPTPTPAPKPVIEVKRVSTAIVDQNALSVAIAFQLRNPSTAEWLLQAVAGATVRTPDGRIIPQAKPALNVDLGPGEERWFAFPSVDTFGSIVGKAEIAITGGQWLPASVYPYPGGVPVTVARGAQAGSIVVKNTGELGVNASLRGFAFDANETFLGIVECPQRLYPARLEVTIACGAAIPDTLKSPRLVFAASADLRPVLVLPTPSPSPTAPPPPPAPSPTKRP